MAAFVSTVPRRVLHLLATERHVESALAEGLAATTWRWFLAKHIAAAGLRAATPEMTRLATAMAMDAMRGELGWDNGPALVSSIDDALGVLRQSAADRDTLRRTKRPRAELLATLLEKTDALLARAGAFDPRATELVAAARIDEAPLDELPPGVIIDGLFAWDASSFAWVEALARRIPVTVRMPRWTGHEGVIARAPEAILSHLEGRWQQLSNGPDLELGEIALPRNVAFVEAATDGAEARAIAGAVGETLSRGTPAEGIAIVLPALDESFLEPLRAHLDDAKIPYSEPRGRAPISTPAVQAALGWLDLAAGPLGRDALVDLLRANVVDPAPFIEGKTARQRRERAFTLCRRLSRIPVGADRDGTLLLDLLAADVGDDADEQWMLTSMTRLLAARREIAGDAPRGELLAKLVQTWRAMGLHDVPLRAFDAWVTADPAGRAAQLMRGQIREHAAGFSALLTAAKHVEEAAAALGVSGARVSVQRLRAELEDALAAVAPVGTYRPGAVRILRVAEVARLRTELLIVARASEGVFENSGSTHAVLGDDLVGALPAAQRPAAASLAIAAGRAALLAAVAGAGHLLVTRSATDSDGRPAAPAAFFAELSAGHVATREPASALHPASRPSSARAAALAALGRGEPSEDGDLDRRVAIERERLAFFLDPRMAASAVTGCITASQGDAMKSLGEAIGGTGARPIAATAIERAALCRFAAFAQNVLRASTTDTAGEELEPWQRGSLVHRALHVAFEAIRAHWEKLGHVELVAMGKAAAARVLLRERTSPLFRAEVERALRDVDAVLEWSLEDGARFKFAHGERSFGETAGARAEGARSAKPWPALRISDGRTDVFVKGRIDRIDLSADGARARIIDYKTGALPAWKDVGTTVFQPPLYAYALWLQMGPLSLPEIRAFYLDTSKRPPRQFPVEKNQVFSPESMTRAQRRAAEVVTRLRQGDIAPRPADALVCSRCSVRDVCRRPAAMPVEDLDAENDGAST